MLSKPAHILKGINLKVHKNRIFGFLGPNGAGKTTTIKTILGLIQEFSGEIKLFEQPIGSPNLRRQIGYSPENAYFSQYLTPREVLTSMGRLSGMNEPDIKERSAHWLDVLELRENIDQPIKTFSKGMKQRLALAQAVLHEPEFLIFDEPATGLDPIGQAQIKKMLLELKKMHRTVFISSHHLLDAQDICDDIAILNKGNVVLQGELDKVLPKGKNLEQFFVETIRENNS
jgi:ABC-2 type transport system ATP-binding protein